MKTRIIFSIIGLILALGLLLYLSKSGLLNKKAEEPPKTEVAVQQTPPEESKVTEAMPEAEEEQEEPPMVEIPLEKQQLIGVKTAVTEIKPMQKIIRTVGRVEYDERKLATINTKFEGWIEKLYIDYTGKYVKKGEPLAEIYSPELYATQQEFISLLQWKEKAGTGTRSELDKILSKDSESLLEAARQRLRLWDITEGQIKTIEETKKPIRTLTVYSPVNGYVVQKMALLGMKVMPGEKLFDIADLSTVWVIADIYEYELPLVKTGLRANISLSYFPGKEFVSVIDYIYPSLSGETRTAKIRFVIQNPEARLKPQMFTNVEIKINLGRKLVIPADAVIDTGMRQVVYVDKGDGYFEPREVVLGLKADDLVEVKKGIKAGERVASAATFLIDSEAQLKGIKPLERHEH